ncbi:probable E3 ubiquitin-protein ligase WAVH2 isoform X2 [Cicer arietinum]|uniref:Probable E3 ubiquitin-protein ligase WAVH2 isoform X2 n=1 Tax=Cicer arietinum TaxID=3827 RepID=A0A1S2XAM1_CICAR|nr:probable E3 ubiquitin-protein ligase WAVH2 isoform X2 [Cicer arietinum]
MREGGRRRGTSKLLREVARKVGVAAAYACGSFSRRKAMISNSSFVSPSTTKNSSGEIIEEIDSSITTNTNNNELHSKSLCAICLDPLSYHSKGSSPSQAIFTAQCSHAFHFACISSNVRHGSVTCPICRAHWTQLPRNLNNILSGSYASSNQSDPILRILDDSIATFRVHRRSILRTARYDDDDPVEPNDSPEIPKLCFSLVPIPPNAAPSFHPALQVTKHASCPCHLSLNALSCSSSSPMQTPYNYIMCPSSNKAYLSVKLTGERATDIVLVASPNGPHLRLLKQAMALVVFSLRHIDRLAIVTYSSAAARVFPLRRMTSYGKRTALQVIDRLFYMGQADPVEGLKKGIKILEDRVHKNPESCILNLSDNPTRPYHAISMELPSTPIHRFHVGFGFGTSSGFVMQEFEEFLAKMLGGIVREIQLRICEAGEEGGNGRVIRIGEIRGGEERRIVLDLGDCSHVYVEYSYIEGEIDECVRRNGESVVGVGEHKGDDDVLEVGEESESERDMNTATIGGRSSNVESWDFHDPYMARRWAKYLHGYRL